MVSISMLWKICSADRRLDLAIADGAQKNRELTVSAMAKSILYRVKESRNAYPPLKSVAGYLWHILDNCEVWPPSCIFNLHRLQLLQQTRVNLQAIGLLAPRVRKLSESLCDPFTAGDINERKSEGMREGKLEQ